MSLSAGTETYGRVKTVRGTPVVTKFAMLQSMPLYPVQSYYYAGESRVETSRVPFVGTTQSTQVYGIPLARLDRHSVAIAYVRGICGALTIVGFMGLVPVIIQLTGEHMDEIGTAIMRVLVTCFFIGSAVGLLTYLLPTPKRERRIRQYCGEQLGIGVDPARVSAEVAANMEARVARDAPSETAHQARVSLIHQLVTARANIAQGIDIRAMEQKTDELLTHLVQLDRYPR